MKLFSAPFELSCWIKLETRLVCFRVAFINRVDLPSGKQRFIHILAVCIEFYHDATNYSPAAYQPSVCTSSAFQFALVVR